MRKVVCRVAPQRLHGSFADRQFGTFGAAAEWSETSSCAAAAAAFRDWTRGDDLTDE